MYLFSIFTVIICLNTALKLLVLPLSVHRLSILFFIFLQLFKLITLLTMTFIDTALKLLNLPAHKLSIPFLYFYRNLHQFCPKIVEPTSCTNLAYIFCTFIEIICIDTALKLLNLPASAHKHSMYTFYSIFTEII